MKGSALISGLNRSKVITALILTGIFLVILYCNYTTVMVLDDFNYCFSFKDGTRIRSVSDIFPSMSAHRFEMNGRVIAHFFVQLFLMLPPVVFDILNAAMFTCLVYLIYRLRAPAKTENAENILLIFIFCVIWVMTPEFGQVYLWLDGSVNYLWNQVICLLWLIPYLRFFFRDRQQTAQNVSGVRLTHILYCLLSFPVGAYFENTTAAMVFMAILFMLLTRFYRKEKIPFWQIASVVMMLIGFCYMISAPAEILHKSSDFSIQSLFDSFLNLVVSYLHFWPLIVAYLIMFIFSLKTGGSKDMRICSLVLLGGSLAAHFVLTFANHQPDRCFSISLILLLCSCSMVFEDAFRLKMRFVLCAACAVCVGFTLFWGIKGIQDLRVVHYKLVYNEQDIYDQIAQGKNKVQVLYVEAETTYSPICSLYYLSMNPAAWENKTMARYFGVDEITYYVPD